MFNFFKEKKIKGHCSVKKAVEIVKEINKKVKNSCCSRDCEGCVFSELDNCYPDMYAIKTLEVLIGYPIDEKLIAEAMKGD